MALLINQKYANEFARRLRNRMEYLRIDQKRLSDHSGVSPSLICKYVHGKAIPRSDTAAKLATALAMPVADLIDFVTK